MQFQFRMCKKLWWVSGRRSVTHSRTRVTRTATKNSLKPSTWKRDLPSQKTIKIQTPLMTKRRRRKRTRRKKRHQSAPNPSRSQKVQVTRQQKRRRRKSPMTKNLCTKCGIRSSPGELLALHPGAQRTSLQSKSKNQLQPNQSRNQSRKKLRNPSHKLKTC